MATVTINKLNLLGTWKYNIIADTCAMCRNNLLNQCLECESNSSIVECQIVTGKCEHSYHYHCISKWLKQRNVCPLDNIKWAYKGEVKNNIPPKDNFINFDEMVFANDNDDSDDDDI